MRQLRRVPWRAHKYRQVARLRNLDLRLVHCWPPVLVHAICGCLTHDTDHGEKRAKRTPNADMLANGIRAGPRLSCEVLAHDRHLLTAGNVRSREVASVDESDSE